MMSVVELIKHMRRAIRKPKKVVPEPKLPKPKPARQVKPKRKVKTAVVDGVELSLSEIARNYGIDIATVYARYRVGNRGKLLIRQSHRKQQVTKT